MSRALLVSAVLGDEHFGGLVIARATAAMCGRRGAALVLVRRHFDHAAAITCATMVGNTWVNRRSRRSDAARARSVDRTPRVCCAESTYLGWSRR